MTKTVKITVCILLLCALSFNIVGCAPSYGAVNLMRGIIPKVENLSPPSESEAAQARSGAADFMVSLFLESAREGENTLVSPLSVLLALAMCTGGAEGETKEQMESVLGVSSSDLNAYLGSYISSIKGDDNLGVANSIWFKDDDRFTVNEGFLETNANYYGAGIFKRKFDKSAHTAINRWVSDNTDGLIEDALDKIDKDAIMYLINTISFEAKWNSVYDKAHVRDGVFTAESGAERGVSLMYSDEGLYLENEYATGFIKHYEGKRYAFVAMLPNEGMTLAEFLKTLDGETVSQFIDSAASTSVKAAIPKFESEYSAEMSELLQNMGMTDAFDGEKADFSALGSYDGYNIYINRVIHKTYISVFEKGTKAGAATVIEMSKNTSMDRPEPKYVILDRPFVYMIIDCEADIPVFMGTLNDIK